MFVADSRRHCIYRISGDTVSLFAGASGHGKLIVGRNALETKFSSPGQLFYLCGFLLVVDGDCILKCGLDGSISMLLDMRLSGLGTCWAFPSLSSVWVSEDSTHSSLYNIHDGSCSVIIHNDTPTLIFESCGPIAIASDVRTDNPQLLGLAPGGSFVTQDLRCTQEIESQPLAGNIARVSHFCYHKETNRLAYRTVIGFYFVQLSSFGIPNLVDLSLLLSPSSSTCYSSTSFVHKQSGTQFNIHDGLLQAQGISPAQLELWASSSLPVSTIRLLLAQLYGKGLDFRDLGAMEVSAPREMASEDDTGSSRNSSPSSSSSSSSSSAPDPLPMMNSASKMDQLKHVCRCIRLLRATGMHVVPAETHLKSELASLSLDDRFELLLSIWTECERDDNMLQLAVAALREYPEVLEERAIELVKLAPDDPSRYNRLIRAHSNSQKLYSPRKRGQVAWSELVLGIHKHFPLRWISNAHPPPHEERSPSSYIFCIADKDGYIESHDWIMYPQWKFFRRMVDSNMAETQTRLITLPSSFPLDLLVNILSLLHALYASPVDKVTAKFLLQRGEEFGLIDNVTHQPFSPFHLMVTEAADLYFNGIDKNRCYKQLGKIARVDSPILSDRAAHFIATHWDVISHKYAGRLASLPSEWFPKVFAILKEERK